MYQKVFQTGKVLRGKPITLRYCRIDADHTRVGFIIRKKVGDACMRNSIRRTLRVSFQDMVPQMPEGTWIIFDVSDKASQLRRAELKMEADQLLRAMSFAAPAAAPASAPVVAGTAAPADIVPKPDVATQTPSTASATQPPDSTGVRQHPKKWNGPA